MQIEAKPLPMKEAMEYWKGKVPLSPAQYRALPDEAKAMGFAVSGIAKQDELATVFQAMLRALEEGTTFADFKKDAASVFEKRGFGSWRQETIFRTNIQTAYQVGRYKQMKEAVGARPYWMYDAVGDVRTRPAHAAMDGMVYPADHEFWKKWYGPNGYNCRCSVRSLSEADVKAKGLQILASMPPQVPDPGFGFNPGESRWGGITPRAAEGGYKDIGIKTYESYKRPKLENLPEDAYLPFSQAELLKAKKELVDKIGGEKAEEYYLSAFMREFGFKSGEGAVIKDKVGEPLLINRDLFTDGKTGKLKVSKSGRERYIKLLARTVLQPYEIWLVPQKHEITGNVILRRRFIRAFSSGPKPFNERDKNIEVGFVAFDYGKEWSGVTAFAPDTIRYANNLRNGVLLYKEGK